jgi:hypothetical protein
MDQTNVIDQPTKHRMGNAFPGMQGIGTVRKISMTNWL